MMQNIVYQIREGIPEDIPQVLELIKGLAEYEKALHEVVNTEEQLLEDGFGANPLYGLYVAASNDKLLGFALFFYRYSTWIGKVMYLEDIYVLPEYRGHKIGQLFFEVLIERAKKEKCARLAWQVLEWNKPAINFYEKLGAEFDAEWVNVFIKL